ncbi:hypothetical protein HDV00_000900 [Rhizophlyctis rosea]|nr:hypothetical protein HDV00_000900 [Rhizophlyctis rosea]
MASVKLEPDDLQAERLGRGPRRPQSPYNVLDAAGAMAENNNAPKTLIHTGNWGCGVYGGHISVMTMIQYAAARIAGIDFLVYHGNPAIEDEHTMVKDGKEALEKLWPLVGETEDVEKLPTVQQLLEGMRVTAEKNGFT